MKKLLLLSLFTGVFSAFGLTQDIVNVALSGIDNYPSYTKVYETIPGLKTLPGEVLARGENNKPLKLFENPGRNYWNVLKRFEALYKRWEDSGQTNEPLRLELIGHFCDQTKDLKQAYQKQKSQETNTIYTLKDICDKFADQIKK